MDWLPGQESFPALGLKPYVGEELRKLTDSILVKSPKLLKE